MDKSSDCEQHYRIPAHPTEFNDFTNEREIDIYITEPCNGINDNTGIMLIVHGAGAYAEAAYFKKLREDWANRYNVITLGVNYLGTKTRVDPSIKFTDSAINKLFEKLTPLQRDTFLSKENRTIDDLIPFFPNEDFSNEIFAICNNSEENAAIKDYCDFGYIQSMDCLYAVYYVLSICKYYGIVINKNRIFAYGSSLGGYIAQMCLRLAPSTFSLVADNSGFVNIPKKEIFTRDYSSVLRTFMANGMIVGLIKNQFYSQDPSDKFYFSPDMFQIRSLNRSNCLKTFGQSCESQIIMFHGCDDQFIKVNEKIDLNEEYIKNNIKSRIYCFSEEDVDGKIIKTSAHAMNADIKKLFEKYCDEYCKERLEENKPEKQTDFDKASIIRYNTENGYYVIDYSIGIPTIKFVKI